MVVATALSDNSSKLAEVKNRILLNAFEIPHGEVSSSEQQAALDVMLGDLGVCGVGESGYAADNNSFAQKYRFYGYDFTELHSHKFGEGAYLLLGSSSPGSVHYKGHSLDLIAISNPLKGRDYEELELLRALVVGLGAEEDVFKTTDDEFRPHGGFFKSRRIRLHQTVMDSDVVLNPDEPVKRLLSVAPAYRAFLAYQKERDKKIKEIAAGLLDKLK